MNQSQEQAGFPAAAQSRSALAECYSGSREHPLQGVRYSQHACGAMEAVRTHCLDSAPYGVLP